MDEKSQAAPLEDIRAQGASAASEDRLSICRLCPSYCPIVVTVEQGLPVKIRGDREAPLYEGYTCPKGRALAEQHTSPSRLLHSMKRQEDGTYAPIASAKAMDEIAERVSDIIAKHGPRSIAFYYGTGIVTSSHGPMIAASWMQAIGSPMSFSPITIDKPGAHIAQAAHGSWSAGHPPFDAAEAWLVIGLNPLISKSGGFPPNNPGLRLKQAVSSGRMKLIVIDPRETETTQRAHIHLKAKPGEDPTILAAMIHVIIEEQLFDDDFLADNVSGFDDLRTAVARYTPAYAALRADVPAEDIVEAARIFARSRYAGVGCGIGPSFSLTGNLTDYLSTSMMTLCGFWSREGDPVTKPNVLLPAYEARAEAMPPHPFQGGGEKLRVRGLEYTVAGMPTGGLAEEILLEGPGQVKALFCMGGNPMMAWPDQHLTSAAMKALDLLVCSDLTMSATARMASYVIAPKLGLEMPATSTLLEALKYHGHLRGIEGNYARYAPVAVDPPEGSDLLSDWELYYGLAQRMGLPLTLTLPFGKGKHLESETQRDTLDMINKPSDDDLIDMLSRASRVPLDVVKQYPHGHIFDVHEVVLPKRPGCDAKLDVGNSYMLDELGRSFEAGPKAFCDDYPYQLLPRRTNRLMNSAGHNLKQLGGLEPYNPAYLHPDDLAQLGLNVGDLVELSSPYGRVTTFADSDKGLRRGCVSIAHGFGRNPDEPEIPSEVGCNVGRLLNTDIDFDPLTGIPRMSGVPIAIVAAKPEVRPHEAAAI